MGIGLMEEIVWIVHVDIWIESDGEFISKERIYSSSTPKQFNSSSVTI